MTAFYCTRNSRATRGWARLRAVDAATVAFESSFDRALVDAFKSQIPYTARRWDGEHKRWLVDPAYAAHCATLAEQYLGVRIAVPQLAGAPAQAETRLVLLEYIGRTKERVPGQEPTATGYADGAWSLIFAESVLRAWFEPGYGQEQRAPAAQATLYAVLGVQRGAGADEIRSAFRRLARVWHPDVNREEGAAEQFMRVKRAYDVLADDLKRRRYDAGLQYEEQAKQEDPRIGSWGPPQQGDYRAPLTCGYLLVEGKPQLGKFAVSKILQWEDATDEQGRVMVSHWPKFAEHFEVLWVTQ